MTLESLKMLSDEQLTAVIARAGELLKQHDRERKEKALADVRSLLEAAGLSLKDVAVKSRRAKLGKTPICKRRQHYQHPTRPELVWNAKGHKPEWLRELEAQGRTALALPSSYAGEQQSF